MRLAAFERLAKMRAEIEKCVEMEEDLRTAAERVTQLMSATPQKAVSSSSRVEEYAVKLVDTQAKRNRLEMEFLTEKIECLEQLSRVIDDKRLRQVLRKRYIEGKSWRAIGAELYCSTRQVLRLNREGLRTLGAVGRCY